MQIATHYPPAVTDSITPPELTQIVKDITQKIVDAKEKANQEST